MLGHGDFDDEMVPRRVEALQNACVVAVGMFIDGPGHTDAVTRDGSVFSWGYELEGLGIPGTALDAAVGESGRYIMSHCRNPQLSCMRSDQRALA